MNFRHLRRLPTLGLLTACVVLTTPVALAGSSGQQVEVYVTAGTDSVEISGHNQIGEEIHQGLNIGANPTKDTGYWWEKTLEITAYTGANESGTASGPYACDVPVSQSSNWYSCYAY